MRELTRGSLRRIALKGTKPEDVVVDGEGRLITGTGEGDIVRMEPDGSHAEVLANTGGRPLGLALTPAGRVLIGDGQRNELLELDAETGELRVVIDRAGGARLAFCNNPAAGADGAVYVTESTTRHGFDEALWDVIENVPSGRLIRKTPDGPAEVLIDGLSFPNAAVVSPDQAFVVFSESTGFRLARLWLRGPREGRCETFADLPGMPDNLSVGSDGLIWVALPSVESDAFVKMQRLPRWARRLLLMVSERTGPRRTRWGVMAFTFEGDVAHEFRGNSSDYLPPTGVAEHAGQVYLSSIDEDSLAAFAVSA